MQERRYYVYIMTNWTRTVVYVGVTNNIARRAEEHRTSSADSFTKRYHVTILVYVEVFSSIYDALRREKQLKAGSRKRKIALVKASNPQWLDISEFV